MKMTYADKCHECSFFAQSITHHQYWCLTEKKFLEHYPRIPEWCPLDDASEEQLEKFLKLKE